MDSERNAQTRVTVPDLRSRHIEDKFDVVVIGAGPAGSACSLAMSRRGMRVLLVDSSEFPRWKVCGCCLGTTGQSVLQQLGLPNVLNSLGARSLQRTQMWWKGRSLVLRDCGIRVVSRGAFDTALVKRASQSGVSVALGWRARVVDCGQEGSSLASVRLVRDIDRSDVLAVHADAVVYASGLASADTIGNSIPSVHPNSLMGLGVASSVVPDWLDASTLRMICSPDGYVGCVLDEHGHAVWGVAVRPATLRESGSPSEAVRRILNHACLPTEHIPEGRWKGTPLLTRRKAASYGRTYTVGDALGYVEPVTGEGMSWALLTGVACGSLLADAHSGEHVSSFQLGACWSAKSRGLMRFRRLRCALVSRSVRNGLLMGAITAIPDRWMSPFHSLATRAIGGQPDFIRTRGQAT